MARPLVQRDDARGVYVLACDREPIRASFRQADPSDPRAQIADAQVAVRVRD